MRRRRRRREESNRRSKIAEGGRGLSAGGKDEEERRSVGHERRRKLCFLLVRHAGDRRPAGVDFCCGNCRRSIVVGPEREVVGGQGG